MSPFYRLLEACGSGMLRLLYLVWSCSVAAAAGVPHKPVHDGGGALPMMFSANVALLQC